MGKKHTPYSPKSPEDLNLTPVYEAAQRVFKDIEIFKPEEYVDIEGTPVPFVASTQKAKPKNRHTK